MLSHLRVRNWELLNIWKMAEYPEKELVDNFMQGDSKAFKEIYNVYFNRIFVFAVKLTGGKEEAEDIASSAYSMLFRFPVEFWLC